MKKIYLLLAVGLITLTASAHGHKEDRKVDKTMNRGYDQKDEKNGKAYGPYNNPGQGNKYGLYKDKKVKKDKSLKAHKSTGKK